jgi:hypothetical protein
VPKVRKIQDKKIKVVVVFIYEIVVFPKKSGIFASRVGEEETRKVHTLEIGGSNPSPATRKESRN